MDKADRTKSGIIFNIQKYSVNDGPGIRTAVFFKGCPLRCRWCANPESQLSKVQILWDKEKCIYCQNCVSSCSQDAVFSFRGQIKIDDTRCIGCKSCVYECPQKALNFEGEIKTVGEILDVVLQDRDFYEESGGGITLSGGEILFQPEFAVELLAASKEEGLHTCCETTGMASLEIFDYVVKQADCLLFDLKHWDSERHKMGTGIINTLPSINMKHAIKIGKEVLPRIPVIPGFNNQLEDAARFTDMLHEVGAHRCQLLPFHQFGEKKYKLLNRKYDYEHISALYREDLQDYLQIFIDGGIEAFF